MEAAANRERAVLRRLTDLRDTGAEGHDVRAPGATGTLGGREEIAPSPG